MVYMYMYKAKYKLGWLSSQLMNDIITCNWEVGMCVLIILLWYGLIIT